MLKEVFKKAVKIALEKILPDLLGELLKGTEVKVPSKAALSKKIDAALSKVL